MLQSWLPIPDIVALGPLRLSYAAIAVMLAVGCGLWVGFRAARSHAEREQATEQLYTVFWIWLVLWKFGVLFSAPSLLWERPAALLLMPGAATEAIWATTASIAYIVWRNRQSPQALRLWLDIAGLALAVGLMVHVLLVPRFGRAADGMFGVNAPHPLHVYEFVLLAIVTGWVLLRRKHVFGAGKTGTSLMAGIGLSLLAASLVELPDPVSFGLSMRQLGGLALAVGGPVAAGLMIDGGTDHTREVDRLPAEAQSPIQIQSIEEASAMAKQQGQDSWEWQNQSKQTAAKAKSDQTDTEAAAEPGIDKKLNGPNRPAT